MFSYIRHSFLHLHNIISFFCRFVKFCVYISILTPRIIQKKIISSNQIPIKEDIYWTSGINGNRIQEALNKWQVDLMPNELYRFMNIEDEDLKIILNAFEINIPKKLFTIGELKNIKTNIKIFT